MPGSLPPIFQDALTAYVEALVQWRQGDLSGAVARAYGALETALVYLEWRGILSIPSGDGQIRHEARRKFASALVHGIDLKTLEGHWETRKRDLYYGSERKRFYREPVRPSPEKVSTLFGDIQRLLLAIAAKYMGEGEQRIVVAQLNAADDHPTVKERLLISIEHPIVIGWYDTPASHQLDLLAFEVFQARIPTDDFYRGWIALLVAHRAMYQGRYRDGIHFANLALEAYRMINEPYRIYHLNKIKAVCYRKLGRLTAARSALDDAFEAAGDEDEYVNALANERALLCLASGAGDVALSEAFIVYRQALRIGEPFLIARRKVTALSTLAGTNAAERAEELGDDRDLWFQSDNIVARSCYLEVQLKLAVGRGDLDSASQHARLLSSLAVPRGLEYHLGAVRKFLPRITTESDRKEEA